MDDTELESRAQVLLRLLKNADPQFPQWQFYDELVAMAEMQVSALSGLDRSVFDVNKSLLLIAHRLAEKISEHGTWQHIGSAPANEIYAAFLSLFPNRLLHSGIGEATHTDNAMLHILNDAGSYPRPLRMQDLRVMLYFISTGAALGLFMGWIIWN